MNLKDYYLANNSIPEWKNRYNTTGRDRIFYYVKSTNFRYLKDFMSIFKKFKAVEGKNRAEWPKNKNGQETHKQHTVNMRVSKFFTVEDGIYYKTKKGEVYDNFIANLNNFNEDEVFIINYLFLLDAYINDEKNYFLFRSNEIYTIWLKYFSKKEIFTLIINFLKTYNKDTMDYIKEPFLFLHSFYDEEDFINLYKDSNKQNKEELTNYIKNNLETYIKDNKNETKIPKDAIAKKYSPKNGKQGQYTSQMLFDDAKILYVSLCILGDVNKSNENLLNNILNNYNRLFKIDLEKIQKYIVDNNDVFEPIFNNLYDDIDEGESEEDIGDVQVSNIEEYDRPYDKIDDTTVEGQKENKRLFTIGKKIAKKLNKYTCALEKFYNCNNHYFTSRYTNQNYMEVHHFLPKEFRNEFEKSIEVQANYLVLCPRCHRMIHDAIDEARKPIITKIFNERLERLKKCGLNIKCDEIYRYYHLKGYNSTSNVNEDKNGKR